jgi:hypothetical protein
MGVPQLFRISPIFAILNKKFWIAYLPPENIYIDESLLLWKNRLGIKQYVPLKAAKLVVKMFEICESSAGDVQYLGDGSVVTTNISVADNLKSLTL